MEGVVTEGRSLPHSEEELHESSSFDRSARKNLDSPKGSLTETKSPPKHVSVLETNLDLTNDTVIDVDSYSQKDVPANKSLASVEIMGVDAISDQRLTSVKKSQDATSLANDTSEVISLKKSDSKTDHLSLGQNSKIISENTSCSQRDNLSTYKKSLESVGIDNTGNKLRKVLSAQKNVDVVNNDINTFSASYDKDILDETKEPTLKYTTKSSLKTLTKSSLKTLTKSSLKTLTNGNRTVSVSSTAAEETKADCIPQCIPPWAKTLRKIYGMTSSDDDVPQKRLQDKIESLMEKHSKLMLVKRGESRKQLIFKPSRSGEMGAVKLTTKNTRFYMTPLPRGVRGECLESNIDSISGKNSLDEKESMDMEATNKTSRHQAKAEVSNILKSLYRSKDNRREMDKEEHKLKLQQTKCPKITPSKVRDYVNSLPLDNNDRKLQEIIQIKKVSSFGSEVGRKPSSKYIINVPQSSPGGGKMVNKITVKEKHKLKIDSVEDINEKITEIAFNTNYSETKEKVENCNVSGELVQDVVPFSKKPKSATQSKTLKVTAKSTPAKPILKKEERDRDKVLLIQYELKSKQDKEVPDEVEKPTLVSTKLFGIRQPNDGNLKEMYLYGTETDGKTCKENITKIEDDSPTLRDKVNLIFKELREMTFKPCEEFDPTSKKLLPSVSSKSSQHPSTMMETDAVSVQAIPDVRSVDVQVNDSIIFHKQQSTDHQPKLSLSLEGDKEIPNVTEDKSDSIRGSLIEERSSSDVRRSQPDMVGEHPPDAVSETVSQTGDTEEEQKVITEVIDTVGSEKEEDEAFEESTHSIEKIEQNKNLEGTEDEDLGHQEENVRRGTQTSQENHEDKISHDLDFQDDKKSIDKLSEENLAEDKDDVQNKEEDQSLVKEVVKEESRSTHVEDQSKGTEQSYKSKDSETFEGGQEVQKESIIEESDKGSAIEEAETEEKSYESGDQREGLDGKPLLEDIRSYDFDPAQDYELRIISSSKFIHKKDSLRKLNWTEDTLYLEKNTCPRLVKGLAEIAERQPQDPISYLAHWIYKDYQNRESDERIAVFKEHIEVAKGMAKSKNSEKIVLKKFNLQRYPEKINESPSESMHEIEETGY